MDPALHAVAPPARAVFQDGLGERRHIVDPTGHDTLELLCLRSELTAVPSFEFALRERVGRLASFRHAYFGRVRSVDRLNEQHATLALVSDHTPGVRLSDLLAVAELAHVPLDINAALCLIRQLVPAVATLHENARDAAHGAIAPERIVIGPNARLVVVEHVMGAALEQLRYSHERYWKDLHVALPRSAGSARFDHRADITQVGVVALALILGRPLREDEYPLHIAEAVASAWAISARGGLEPLPAGLRSWLARALQLEPRNSFTSALEARDALDKVLGDSDYIAAPAAVEAFLTHYHAAIEPSPGTGIDELAPPRVEPAPIRVDPPVRKVEPPVLKVEPPAPKVEAPAYKKVEAPAYKPEPPVVKAETPAPKLEQPVRKPEPPPFTFEQTVIRVDPPIVRAAPAVARVEPPIVRVDPPIVRVDPPIVRVDPPVAKVAPPIFRAEPPPASKPESIFKPEPSIFKADPPPAALKTEPLAPAKPAPSEPRPEPRALFMQTVDEERQSEDHEEPEQDTGRRWSGRTIAIAAVVLIAIVGGGAFAARQYAATPASAGTGTLSLNTTPTGAQVVVDGQVRGVTPLTLTLNPGAHSVTVQQGDGEPRSVPITITAGAQVSQYIELPKGAPAVGQLQIRTEPAGAAVSVDGVARGKSPLTIPNLAAGEHTVAVESDRGSVKQSVTIEAGATASLVVPLTPVENAPVSGWISVSAPVSVQLFENKQLIGTSQSDRVMVSAGRHEIEIVSEPLGYRVVRTVQVPPGRVASIKLEFPKGTIALNAVPWAEVWIDGVKAGDTPIGNLAVTIGPHEIVFRHPELGEQKHAITVSLTQPARLSVDLRKK